MSDIALDTFKSAISALIAEGIRGPDERWTWFVNVAPDAGVLGTIEPLTAEQASRPPREGGRSIAAHVEHMRWHLALVNRTLRGEPWQPDWSASWSVQTVDAAQWDELRSELRREVNALLDAIDAIDDWSDPKMLTGTMAIPAHTAHHLGTVREIAREVGAL